MKGGILEVLLVSAEGLKNSRHPSQYVVIECGNQAYQSKTTSGKDKKIWWNEKFKFKFVYPDWRSKTQLRLRIMDKDTFTDAGTIGQAIVHLGGIIREGGQKGCVELKPAPYNVVLADGTYAGEIKIGLKFIANVELQTEIKEQGLVEKQPRSIYRSIFDFNLRRLQWQRVLFFRNHSSPAENPKNK
ncbi:hypothetical protein QJS10_CPB18g01576 [Acorus calamus]|uniref:C2 domain-containing protein n=1 Tax=Acorus calamus TaxID=4465 RepID=A0AAV9CLI3_ACOCL|nr:hypothetical protein QJS10_CPB18g01576 [Acorus calamus]